MNADRLLALYDCVADAPDAIARLRRFVLDLAVRGKLVGQDPTDEPVPELLERIAAEKVQLVKAGEIKKQKPLPPVDESPFDIPPSWRWTRLSAVAEYIQRGKSPKYATGDGSLVVSQKCVQWAGLDLSVAKLITHDSLSNYEPYRFLRDGDLLWNSTGTGTIGRVIRLKKLPDRLVCDSHVTVVRCPGVEPDYIRIWLRSDHVYGDIEQRAAGSTNQVELTTTMANAQPTPLPPLAEQHRIVAKVDELMTLCDRLEAVRAQREDKRDRLTTACLARLSMPDADAEAFRTHARFTLDTLPALTTRPDQIKALRQAILNLAVRGKLAEQDPTDLLVAKSLSKMAEARSRLENEGKIRRLKEMKHTSDPPFALPGSWAWCLLSQVSDVVDPNPSHRMPTYVTEGGLPFISSENFAAGDTIDFSIGKRVAKATVLEQMDRFPILEGAFGFSRIGTIGKTRSLPMARDYAISHAVCVVNPLDLEELSMRYLRLAMAVDAILAHAHGGTRSIGVPDLGMGVIRTMAIPLPPLAEQHRIVAKVDALMAICDKLEASLAAADTARRSLLEALLHEALAPATEALEAA